MHSTDDLAMMAVHDVKEPSVGRMKQPKSLSAVLSSFLHAIPMRPIPWPRQLHVTAILPDRNAHAYGDCTPVVCWRQEVRIRF